MFELSFRFKPEDLDEPALLKAVGIEDKAAAADPDGDVTVARTLGHREQETDYHGHIRIAFQKDGTGNITLRYHADRVDIKDEQPPYVEDFSQWLADFFKQEEMEGRINASYTFDNSFAPTIALPFPLATSEKALTGASVNGVSIRFPEKHPLDLAIVQRSEGETYTSVYAQFIVNLRSFDLSAELRRLAVLLDSVVRKVESNNNDESTPSNA